MELEAYIQTYINYEKNRMRRNPAASEKAQIWISTIEHAPRSIEALQSLMDAKEVAMNKAEDITEVQTLDRQWSALFWLQSAIHQVKSGRLREA